MQKMTCHNGFARLGDGAGRRCCLAGESSNAGPWSVGAISCADGSRWYRWIGSARAADHRSADVIKYSFIFCSSNEQMGSVVGREKLDARGGVFI